jgi:hypothetical protein
MHVSLRGGGGYVPVIFKIQSQRLEKLGFILFAAFFEHRALQPFHELPRDVLRDIVQGFFIVNRNFVAAKGIGGPASVHGFLVAFLNAHEMKGGRADAAVSIHAVEGGHVAADLADMLLNFCNAAFSKENDDAPVDGDA